MLLGISPGRARRGQARIAKREMRRIHAGYVGERGGELSGATGEKRSPRGE
jgi:hypothetical protein